MFEITEAKREGAPITAAIIGGSGSGKTYSALLLARGLVGPGGKIVVIDTEGGRSKIYADDPDIGGFYHLNFVEPYSSERFKKAFREAEAAGADAIIIDTISHEHEGFLEYAEAEEKRINAKYAARNKWIKPKAERKRFYSAVSSSHAHCIVTIRLNRIVDMDQKPPKEIYKPECDKDLPYRLDLSVELDPKTHATKYLKVPKPLIDFVENSVPLAVKHGEMLAKDNASRPKPKGDAIQKVINNLAEAAESGSDTLKNAWEAAWRNAGPSNDTKTLTADRTALQANLERLKGIAAKANDVKPLEPGEFGEMPVTEAEIDDEIEDKGLFNAKSETTK